MKWSSQEHRVLKHRLETDHQWFTRWSLKARKDIKLVQAKYQQVLSDTADKVLNGEITRLLINIPPGYAKTDYFVVNLITRGLIKEPRSRYIHTTYSKELALTNSSKVKGLIEKPDYQQMWPMIIRADESAKGLWRNESGGGMRAGSSGSAITGFRAGVMGLDGYSGALIGDDLLKPKDAHSDTVREGINKNLQETLFNRLAHQGIPIIIIGQRLHESDAFGHLLTGGTSHIWDHLMIPGVVPGEGVPGWEDEFIYPKEWTHGRLIEHGLPPGPIFPYKHTLEQHTADRKANPYVYSAQFDQNPTPPGGALFHGNWWRYYDALPDLKYLYITADTAQEVGKLNDYTVFQLWGYGPDDRIYLVDQLRGKWEAPGIEANLSSFYAKARKRFPATPFRKVFVEKKSSGSSLIQKAQADKRFAVTGIERGSDQNKVTRAVDICVYLSEGKVVLPKSAFWLADYLKEFEKFTPAMTHKHDDQIDPTIDAIDLQFGKLNHLLSVYQMA